MTTQVVDKSDDRPEYMMLVSGGLFRVERPNRLSTGMVPSVLHSRTHGNHFNVKSLLQIRRGVFQKHWLLADLEDEPRHPGFYLV